MSATLLLLLSVITVRGFAPNVRIDHEYNPTHECRDCAMAIGPGAPSGQPIYVVFEDDSTVGPFRVRTDVMFQKSTDGGRTWLSSDLLIQRGDPFADSPDITTDSDGNVYIVYAYHDTAVGGGNWTTCVRSVDGGATWSAPARVDDESVGLMGLTSIAADSAGNLFVAWNQLPGGLFHIFTSVSTDKGATWSPRVCVDDDTLTDESSHDAVFVQPGTNHYLVAATTYREGHNRPLAYLYRSTDQGRTFEPGVQLDTFDDAGSADIVADRDHIICAYFGNPLANNDTIIAESRTYYTQADSWGTPAPMTNLDPDHRLYYSGPLALSGDGRVHTALMVQDTADSRWNVYYTSSSNHGVSWSDLELVTDDTTVNSWYPDIAADIAGYAYVVWYQFDGALGTEWFTTNSPAGIAEEPTEPGISAELQATVVRNVLVLGAVDSRLTMSNGV